LPSTISSSCHPTPTARSRRWLRTASSRAGSGAPTSTARRSRRRSSGWADRFSSSSGRRRAGSEPARFYGIAFTVDDLDATAALLGDRLGRVKDAVQPGRRIATLRREAGAGIPLAFMSPGADSLGAGASRDEAQ
jgi:hypothetical protein